MCAFTIVDAMMMPSLFPGTGIADETAQFVAMPGHSEPPAAARWQAAEGRLYPLITVDTELYEAAVTLVGEAADVLRGQCATVAELVDVEAASVLARCPSTSVVAALGVGPDIAFEAACAHRWRELTAAPAADEQHPSDQESQS
jgi:hypothetical protein